MSKYEVIAIELLPYGNKRVTLLHTESGRCQIKIYGGVWSDEYIRRHALMTFKQIKGEITNV